MRALVTGASSGIGRDIAKVLSQKGYDLVLVARDEKQLKKVQKEIKTKSIVKVVDLTNREACLKLHEEEKDIDLLVNNAGFGDCGLFNKTDLDKELAMIDTNITAYHILMKLYLKDMVKKDKGTILNVASIAGFMPGPLMATYYATKAYIVRISEAIRQELKKENSKVQISILCPGPVETNFNKVANVDFHLREANSMKVAKYAIEQLEKKKFYIIPGVDVKIAKYAGHIVPDTILAKICFKAQERKIRGNKKRT